MNAFRYTDGQQAEAIHPWAQFSAYQPLPVVWDHPSSITVLKLTKLHHLPTSFWSSTHHIAHFVSGPILWRWIHFSCWMHWKIPQNLFSVRNHFFTFEKLWGNTPCSMTMTTLKCGTSGLIEILHSQESSADSALQNQFKTCFAKPKDARTIPALCLVQMCVWRNLSFLFANPHWNAKL